ncbi:hypothetical protein [Isoptericola sp. QY 916]|uniref:hypothetical protein n=1 Tax=Isoptericola sp. QY 916 TaxID=2782570 RepID=UPI003D2FA923|nr:hypothetical protein [Isoptericola sp. QY 916]
MRGTDLATEVGISSETLTGWLDLLRHEGWIAEHSTDQRIDILGSKVLDTFGTAAGWGTLNPRPAA